MFKHSEELAEFAGLAFGDGSLTYRKGTNKLRFQLRGDAKSDREHYLTFVIPLCNKLLNPILGRNVALVEDRKKNSFGVSIESAKIKAFFDFVGVPIGVKRELYTPGWIKEKREYSKAFVRGLFDTDGTISYLKNNTAKTNLHIVDYVSIVSTSKNLIEETSYILEDIGLKHYIKSFKSAGNVRRAYLVAIYRPHVKEFMAAIGSHNAKHLTKFEIGQKFGFCPPYTTLEQRKQILKGFVDPLLLYNSVDAGVG